MVNRQIARRATILAGIAIARKDDWAKMSPGNCPNLFRTHLLTRGVIVEEVMDTIVTATRSEFPQARFEQFIHTRRSINIHLIQLGSRHTHRARRESPIRQLASAIGRRGQMEQFRILREIDDLRMREDLVIQFQPCHGAPSLFTEYVLCALEQSLEHISASFSA
jgi:hypothetical protein